MQLASNEWQPPITGSKIWVSSSSRPSLMRFFVWVNFCGGMKSRSETVNGYLSTALTPP